MFPIMYHRLKAFLGRMISTDPLFTITIYTKSGNVITLRNLTEFKYTPGETLKWKFDHTVHRLIHIDIDQIEAIVQE